MRRRWDLRTRVVPGRRELEQEGAGLSRAAIKAANLPFPYSLYRDYVLMQLLSPGQMGYRAIHGGDVDISATLTLMLGYDLQHLIDASRGELIKLLPVMYITGIPIPPKVPRARYTAKSNARNHSLRTVCTRNANACV